MTLEQKQEMIKRLYDAYSAGYISANEYLTREKAVNKAYFDTKYGTLDLSDIPS